MTTMPSTSGCIGKYAALSYIPPTGKFAAKLKKMMLEDQDENPVPKTKFRKKTSKEVVTPRSSFIEYQCYYFKSQDEIHAAKKRQNETFAFLKRENDARISVMLL